MTDQPDDKLREGMIGRLMLAGYPDRTAIAVVDTLLPTAREYADNKRVEIGLRVLRAIHAHERDDMVPAAAVLAAVYFSDDQELTEQDIERGQEVARLIAERASSDDE